MRKEYYIATAIAYASGKPHIGNTYEIVLADAIARYKRSKGFDVYFQTGTDEHGEKVEKNAFENGVNPKEYVDNVSSVIKGVWDKMNTSYDRFIRTTDEDHKRQVQGIFERLYNQGDIYKDNYSGWYCVACESFFTDSQLSDGICPDCGRKISKHTEEAYFFKLSNYSDRLIKHIEDNPEFLRPESRKNEMINNFLKPGLHDLAVSRKNLEWGIKVPFDDEHVIYVWIDALSNYITFLDYENNGEMMRKYWPCDLHLIGKDIFRFHAIYWPILLMALDLPLPEQVFGHPWLLMKDGKMSKSTGNVVYADDLVDIFGIDAVRYFMLHEIPFANDGVFSKELLIDVTNNDLVNVVGNLVNRTVSMVNQYLDGSVSSVSRTNEFDIKLEKDVLEFVNRVDSKMDELRVADALDSVIEMFKLGNKYIDVTTPWILGREGKLDRLNEVLSTLVELINIGGILLGSFLPDLSLKILEQINMSNVIYDDVYKFENLPGVHRVSEAHPIIMRLDKTKLLEEGK